MGRHDALTTVRQNYTYLLRCADGTLYCGWTNDLEKRVAAHNAGLGAKYTKTRRISDFRVSIVENGRCRDSVRNSDDF